MLHNIIQPAPEPRLISFAPKNHEAREFSVPIFDLMGELRPSSVAIMLYGQPIEVTTHYSFRISKWRELHGLRTDQSKGSHRYYELDPQSDQQPDISPHLNELSVMRTGYVLDSIFGDLFKLCWVMVGSVGPSALLTAPVGKVLSRCPLPRRFISPGLRLHSISPELARKIIALRESRKKIERNDSLSILGDGRS